MNITEIIEGDIVLARHIPSEIAWKDGLNFYSNDDDFVQVGTWKYASGKKLLAHTHNECSRTVLWTQEVLYVRKGSLRAFIYNTKEELVSTILVAEGDLIILLRGGHGYDIVEDGTQVLEIKNGPYLGADVDRRRL
jgi:hypothetical protein